MIYSLELDSSLVSNLELRVLLKENLMKNINDKNVFMDGINQSYRYENMEKYLNIIISIYQENRKK